MGRIPTLQSRGRIVTSVYKNSRLLLLLVALALLGGCASMTPREVGVDETLDRATAELMTRFYRNLLEGERSPSAALRQAQLELSSKARWRSPYFWGAFVLQGEWK